MATYERKYQRVKWEQILDCVRWCQNKLQLRDWEIDVRAGQKGQIPEDYASMIISEDAKWRHYAILYVDLAQMKNEDINPYRSICHELIHILTVGKCHISSELQTEEYIPYIFEDLLYLAYCQEKKIKPSEIKLNVKD